MTETTTSSTHFPSRANSPLPRERSAGVTLLCSRNRSETRPIHGHVDEAVYEPFLDGFTQRVRGLRVGDPNQPDTVIGPIINRRQMEGLQQSINDARGSGVRQMTGGDPDGLVLPPHVFADVTNEMPLAREELFGPVAPIIRAKGEHDALAIANDTEFGLSSCVFTQDIERGVRFAQRVQAGMTHVNDRPVNDLPFNPFGGEKNHGSGRFNGRWGIDAFTTDHWITIQHRPRPFPTNAEAVQGPWAGG